MASLRTAIYRSWPAIMALLTVMAVRLCAHSLYETLERSWLDKALQIRAGEHLVRDSDSLSMTVAKYPWGFAKPLDERIRFVELNMNQGLAEKYAQEGEFAVTGKALRSIAALGPRVIVLDILYAFGRESDLRLLAQVIDEIQAEGITKIVVPIEIRPDGKLTYSLPTAGGEKLRSGTVNMQVDEDRIWRRYRWLWPCGQKALPSLALAAYSAMLPDSLAPKAIDGEPNRWRWKALDENSVVRERTVDDQPIYLNLPYSYFNSVYDRESKLGQRVWTFNEVEQAAQSMSRIDESLPFQDAIVFVGFGSDFDGKPTAHGAIEPGMMLHAVALNDLLHQSSLHRASLWSDLVFLSICTIIAGFALSIPQRQRSLLIVAALGGAVIGLVSLYSIWHWCYIPSTVAALTLWGLVFRAEILRRWSVERHTRTERDAMLGFYFSPAVLKQVVSDVEMIRPRGGQLAALLSDLRGFTSCCERLPPEDVFTLLNRLFEIETQAALRENGSLRPFSGDQFLAYWGAPEACVNSADRALRAAIEIQQALTARRSAPAADSLDELLKIGIGLHYGPALVGHVGSRQYRDYNILGDLINTAARVESQTKVYQAPILATGEFIAALTTPIQTILLDHVQLKGRSLATKLYAIFDRESSPQDSEKVIYDEALAQYAKGNFGEALSKFQSLHASQHAVLRSASNLLAQRCNQMQLCPPQEWQGVFSLATK